MTGGDWTEGWQEGGGWAETKLKRSLDDAPIGLCYLDTDLRFVHINEWLAKINGVPV